jgi:cell division transport system permease protein
LLLYLDFKNLNRVNKKETGLSKARLRGSYITLIVSVSLVLFLLGVLGLVIINARGLSDYLKESLSFSIMLHEDTKDSDIITLQKDLNAMPWVKSTEYISKDEAAAKLKKDLGEDFVNYLGYNPLSPSIDVYLYARYTKPDSVSKIEKHIMEYSFVKEIYYQQSLLYLINENVKKISLFIIVISALLFLIALTIINNTIRLSVYSKRFLIRTMQLVGATKSFIRRPFLIKSVFHGLIAGILAIILLLGLIYLVEKEFVLLLAFQDIGMFYLLGAGIILTGIIINLISTFFSVNKYLFISEDKLYF